MVSQRKQLCESNDNQGSEYQASKEPSSKPNVGAIFGYHEQTQFPTPSLNNLSELIEE